MKAWMVAVLVATLALVMAALVKETLDNRSVVHAQAQRDASTTARIDCVKAWTESLEKWIDTRTRGPMPPFTCASIRPTAPAPTRTVTRTVTAAPSPRTVTATPAPAPTRTVTRTRTVPGPTVTRTVARPGPTVTVRVPPIITTTPPGCLLGVLC